MKNKKQSSRSVLIVIIAIVLVLVLVPTTVTYQARETYTEKEPVQVPLSYQVTDASYYGDLEGLFNYVTNVDVQVKNTDTEPGTFLVRCNLKTLKRGTFTDAAQVYIVPAENKLARCVIDTKFGEDVDITYTVEPGTKTVYRDVEKTKTVTRTREVKLYQKLLGLY